MRSRTKETSYPQHGGFTLVELLVVIAIIALLSAILFPIYTQAREKARRSSCQSNIRFIGLGIRQYAQDYDERLPLVNVNDTGVSASVAYGWADAINPYTKIASLFQCPSDKSSYALDSNSNGTIFDDNGSVDYFYNSRLSGEEEAKINFASAVIMLGDYDSGDARNAYDGGSGSSPLLSGASGSGNVRHPDGANYAFADGHVKWLKPGWTLGGGASPNMGYTYGVG